MYTVQGMVRSQIVCFVVFARPGHKAPSHPCAVPRCAASACRVVRSTPPPANTNPSRSRNATALRSTGRHVYPWLAICCNMHARTHAHPWMASATFGRSGPAMRVLRTVARRQKRPGNVKRAPASVSCTYHTRRGLCQDLTAGRGMVEPAHSALASSSFSSYQDSCRRPVTDPQQPAGSSFCV